MSCRWRLIGQYPTVHCLNPQLARWRAQYRVGVGRAEGFIPSNFLFKMACFGLSRKYIPVATPPVSDARKKIEINCSCTSSPDQQKTASDMFSAIRQPNVADRHNADTRESLRLSSEDRQIDRYSINYNKKQ